MYWYKKAAIQEYPQAQFVLGASYLSGDGVNQDDIQALEWFEKAMKNGMLQAAYWIGYMHENGRGVEMNKQKAIEMYRIAARAGSDTAIEKLREMGELQPK